MPAALAIPGELLSFSASILHMSDANISVMVDAITTSQMTSVPLPQQQRQEEGDDRDRAAYRRRRRRRGVLEAGVIQA
jgi:hypothetical protein